ncbi:hypothetical protein RDI58_007334 [Solanum bulbocastanum]|uniref:Uncharacterized protein n=1 Tax=Solanum bulbocastanum TaxID=147425 RepID=A0AAN8U0R7_SOLBU
MTVEGYMKEKKIKIQPGKEKAKRNTIGRLALVTKNYLILSCFLRKKKISEIEETFFKVSETFSDRSLLLPEKICFVDSPAVPSLLSRER